MKYRVTEKHPYLKKDLIIENLGESGDYGYNVFQLGSEQDLLGGDAHLDWLKDGWIEEIQEPQFTKDDMKTFGNYCLTNHLCYGANNASEAFNNWIKKIRNESKYKQ